MGREKKIKNILERGVAEIIDSTHLKKKLLSGRKLRIKLGIDPTAPGLHLGFASVFKKLREFQELGHRAILLIGDFTARIGDPSGQSQQRKLLTPREINENLKSYQRQISHFLDLKKTEWRFNSEWYQKQKIDFFLKLLSSVSYNQIITRADFQKRIKRGQELGFIELLYPLLQGYDSVALKADVELGGLDQKFNLIIARKIQRHFKQPEEDLVLLPLLIGTDGERKMSKSYDNTINIDEKPREIFGKIMKLPDKLLTHYFELLTDVSQKYLELMRAKIAKNKAQARDYKFELATRIVSWLHSTTQAKRAAQEFEEVFKEKKLPRETPVLKLKKGSYKTVDLLIRSGLVGSRSQAQRLLKQGAIDRDGHKLKDGVEKVLIKEPSVFRVGKYKFFKVEV